MWMRKFRLELDGPEVRFRAEDYRMDFTYFEYFKVGSLTNMADTFDLQIFNLSVETYKSLISDKEVRIKFYAGYGDADALDLVFEGIVTNVTGRRSLPEHITTLYCIPRGLAKANKKVSYVGSREDTIGSVIEGVASQLGLNVKYEGVEDIMSTPYMSKTVQGIGINQLIQLGEEFSFMPRVEDLELRIIAVPDANSVNGLRTVHHLRAELMRGSPVASVAKMEIPYAFNTKIRTGEVIDTSVLLGSRTSSVSGGYAAIVDVSGLGSGTLHYADGLHRWAIVPKYQVMQATHEGSNYTTKYISHYSCATYINSKKGGVS